MTDTEDLIYVFKYYDRSLKWWNYRFALDYGRIYVTRRRPYEKDMCYVIKHFITFLEHEIRAWH